jgi:hypothetical protein
MALPIKELCALILCCPSVKPVETASPRLLKLMMLAGGEKGFMTSTVGVDKRVVGVVAPLGVLLWSDAPEDSRKRGRGGYNGSSREASCNDVEDDEAIARRRGRTIAREGNAPSC